MPHANKTFSPAREREPVHATYDDVGYGRLPGQYFPAEGIEPLRQNLAQCIERTKVRMVNAIDPTMAAYEARQLEFLQTKRFALLFSGTPVDARGNMAANDD
jgi:hypothetical protein